MIDLDLHRFGFRGSLMCTVKDALGLGLFKINNEIILLKPVSNLF